MKLKLSILFMMGIVQAGFGQSINRSDLRGSSEITIDINANVDIDHSICTQIDVRSSAIATSTSVNTPFPIQVQNLFLWNGNHGVYLEVTLPFELSLPEERIAQSGSDDFHQVCHLDS